MARLHLRDLLNEKLVIHGDLTHPGAKPINLLIAGIARAMLQPGCARRQENVPPAADIGRRRIKRPAGHQFHILAPATPAERPPACAPTSVCDVGPEPALLRYVKSPQLRLRPDQPSSVPS